MERLQMSLSQALSSDQFTILAKQRLLNFKKASFGAIDAVAPLVSANTELRETNKQEEEKVAVAEETTPKKTTRTSRSRSSKKKAASVTSS